MWVPCSRPTWSRSSWRSACRSWTSSSATADSLPIAARAVQAIFGALAGGMITFTGIVFSAVFVAAQIQTSSYSPQARGAAAARSGRDRRPGAADRHRDLLAVRARGDRPPDRPRRPRLRARCDGDLRPACCALVTLGAFVALVQRAFESTQIGGILRALMRRGYAVIEDVHPRDAAATPRCRRARRRDVEAAEVTHAGAAAVIAAIDRAALLRLADRDRRLRGRRARWSASTSRRAR